MRPEGQEFEDAKKLFMMRLAEESSNAISEYELFLYEHVQNTRAARIAAMAPSHAQWAAIIRQQNALHRQLERKIRLLDEMQQRRRKTGSTMDRLSKLTAFQDHSDEPEDGGQQTPSGEGAPRPTAPDPSPAPVGALGEAPKSAAPEGRESGSAAPTCGKPAAFQPTPRHLFLPMQAGRRSLPACGSRVIADGAGRKGEAFPQVRRRSRFSCSTGTNLVRISHHEGEGRGFSPAVARPTDCSPPSPPARLAAASCAGGEAKRGGTPPIAAGLKPRPSGAPGEPPCAGEKSGSGTLRETPGFAQKIKNRGNEAKESLKTKEIAKTRCAKRTHICAPKAANEAKKGTFRCKNGTSTGGSLRSGQGDP
jgi:hypothetical protein